MARPRSRKTHTRGIGSSLSLGWSLEVVRVRGRVLGFGFWVFRAGGFGGLGLGDARGVQSRGLTAVATFLHAGDTGINPKLAA